MGHARSDVPKLGLGFEIGDWGEGADARSAGRTVRGRGLAAGVGSVVHKDGRHQGTLL
jgi:hypothetical protein